MSRQRYIGSISVHRYTIGRNITAFLQKYVAFDSIPKKLNELMNLIGHCILADPSVIEKIASGLNPNEKEHGITLDFYEVFIALFLNVFDLIDFDEFQFSGTPLAGAKRLQLNWDVVPLEDVPIMKDLQEMLMPMIWLEEGVQLNKTFVNMLKYQLIL